MAESHVPAVRLERQPHRDAVHRLREAYRQLQRSRAQPAAEPPPPVDGAEAVPAEAQEVSA